MLFYNNDKRRTLAKNNPKSLKVDFPERNWSLQKHVLRRVVLLLYIHTEMGCYSKMISAVRTSGTKQSPNLSWEFICWDDTFRREKLKETTVR